MFSLYHARKKFSSVDIAEYDFRRYPVSRNVDRGVEMDKEHEKVPIHLKLNLTVKEAAEYSNIGINKIDAMLKQPNCPFVLYVGSKKLVKRKEFEAYISSKLII